MKKFLVSILSVTTVMVLVLLSGSAEAVPCAGGTLTDYLPGGTDYGCTQQDKIWKVETYSGGGGNPAQGIVQVDPQAVLGPGADLHALQFSLPPLSPAWTQTFTLSGSIAIVAPPGNLFMDDAKFTIGTCIFSNSGCTGHVDGSKSLSGGTALVLNVNFGPVAGSVIEAQAFYTPTQAQINWVDSFVFTGEMQVLSFTNQFSQVTQSAPEPGTLLLLGSGLACLGLMRRIRGR